MFSSTSLSDCENKIYIKNKVYLKRKKNRLGNKLNRIKRSQLIDINLSKLNEDNRKLIQLIYKKLLKNQLNNLKPISSINSLSGYQENYNCSKISISLIEELDRFSSILLDEKPTMNETKPKIDLDEHRKIKENKINEEYTLKIEPIQKELMPIWSNIDSDERLGIIDLYSRWESSLENNFNRIKFKQKSIKPIYMNYLKLAQKGEFNFEANKLQLKKMQIDLLEISTDEKNEIKPNTRVLLKSFKEFLNAFDSLHESKLNSNSYWHNLNIFLIHMSKSILRCAFYVHENANLYKASIGLPPIYVLESDDMSKNDQIRIKLETLYHYVYLCLNQLNINVRKEDLVEETNQNLTTRSKRERKFYNRNLKLKFYKLILNCLVRLIQLCSLVRDSVIMKQVNYQNENVTDIDIYSHFISNECKLVKEYLKEIIQRKI